ncbi:MAG: DsbA family protein [Ardenticatenales bacterium]
MAKPTRSGVSWPLIGIVIILAVLFIGGLMYMLTPKDVRSPLILTYPAASPLPFGVTDDGHPYLGKADAPVTFTEFADFQCPHCKQHNDVFAREIDKTFVESGKAKLVWMTFPILGDGTANDESVLASMAGYCALDQSKFWEMHDWLFENQGVASNQGQFSTDRLRKIAERIGLDLKAWDACMGGTEARDKANKDGDRAKELGIGSTPSFMVGDTIVEGTGQDKMSELAAAIDKPAQ